MTAIELQPTNPPAMAAGRRATARLPWTAWAPAVVTALLIGLFCAWFVGLAIGKHAALQSNAADLGYYSQAAWNVARGVYFRSTLMEAMVVRIPQDADPAELADPGSLLAFHVEPIFLLIGQLYRVWPGPETLLVVQVIGAAIGAWPIHRIAARSLGSAWAGPVFAAGYLLAPPLHWALLSDFHPTVVGAGAVAFVYDFALGRPANSSAGAGRLGRLARFARRTDAGLLLAAAIALSAREDVGLVVLPIAVYRLIRGPRRWAGAVVAVGTAAWLAAAATIVLPAHGAGPSPYVYRYAHLGGSLPEIGFNLLRRPNELIALFLRPEAHRFLIGAVAMTGGLWLLAPLAIVPALPIVGINLLSTWPWMAAGEAHYSVLIVPALWVGAAIGAGAARRGLRRLSRVRPIAAGLVAGYALAAAILWSRTAGLTPLNTDYRPPVTSDHARLLTRFAAQIPAAARVSASSEIYPHLSSRPAIYLFPTVRDAEYVLVDVTGRSFPTSPADQYFRVWGLLDSGEFGAIDGADGYLLLRRGAGRAVPPEEFYGFVRQADRHALPAGARPGPIPIRVAWDTTFDGPYQVVVITTEWLAAPPLPEKQAPILRAHLDGGVRDLAPEAAGLWWIQGATTQPGQRLVARLPGLAIGDLRSIEIGPIGGPSVQVPIRGRPAGEATIEAPAARGAPAVGAAG